MNLCISLTNDDKTSTVEEKRIPGRELQAASHSYPPLLVIATPRGAEAEECAVPMRTVLCSFLRLNPLPYDCPDVTRSTISRLAHKATPQIIKIAIATAILLRVKIEASCASDRSFMASSRKRTFRGR